MNSQQCLTMMAAMKSGCQNDAEFWAAVAELQRQSDPDPTAPSASEGPVVGWRPTLVPTAEGEVGWFAEAPKKAAAAEQAPKKAKKVAAGGGAEAPKEHRPPSAWNLLVTQTVSEMKQSGWESWTTVEGVLWPGSVRALVKDKKGVESEQFVYASGEHAGKVPSPALGGMLRASYLKTQSDPAHGAKAAAHRAARVAQLAEKRSVGSASASPSDAEGEPAAKKAGRPKMTEEQKAVAKAKRAAKKAAEAAVVAPIEGLQGEWAEEE